MILHLAEVVSILNEQDLLFADKVVGITAELGFVPDFQLPVQTWSAGEAISGRNQRGRVPDLDLDIIRRNKPLNIFEDGGDRGIEIQAGGDRLAEVRDDSQDGA